MKPKKQSNTITRRNFLLSSTLAAGAFTLVPRKVIGGKGYVSPGDKINIGFIGTGKQAGGLFEQFANLPDVQVTACCDVDSQKLNKFKKQAELFYAAKSGIRKYNGCIGYEKYEDLIARTDIDAVVIVTPDHWHAILAIAAMKAGKDVFCEKPMAHTIEEGRAMVEATRKYNRVFQTGSMQRSWWSFRHACELVRNNYLGEIKKILVNVGDPAIECKLKGKPTPGYLNWNRWLGPAQLRSYNPILSPPITAQGWPMWREYREYGGGILSDWGAHMFDVAQWGLGMDNSGPVKLISPAKKNAVRGLKFIYQNGVEMFHEDFKRGWAVRFIGSEGTLDVSRGFLESKPENIVYKRIGDNDTMLYRSTNHYSDWTQAIRNRTKPICDVEIGHRSASVCNLANIAYRLGRSLDWDPEKEEFKNDPEANKLRSKEYREPYRL
jgi:predicted dehydrogenase